MRTPRFILFTLLIACAQEATRESDASSHPAALRKPEPAAEPVAATVVAPAPAEETVEQRMHAQLLEAIEMRDAIIRGDLGAAKDPADWLSETPGNLELRDAWNPFLAQMQAAAHEVRHAPTIDEAARALAEMGSTCGDCHRALRVEVTAPAGEPPPNDSDTAMLRHQWAVDRMWDGLVLPDAATWKRGAEVLSRSSVPIDAMEDPKLRKSLAATKSRVHRLSTKAMAARDVDAQVRVYGELLSTCSTCHQVISPPETRD